MEMTLVVMAAVVAGFVLGAAFEMILSDCERHHPSANKSTDPTPESEPKQ